MVTAQPFAAVHEKNLLFRQTRPVQNRCGAVQTKKHGEALANAGSPWYTVGVERCCRRTVASRDMADYSVKLGRLVDGVIFLLCKKELLSVSKVKNQNDNRNDGTNCSDESKQLSICNHAHHLPEAGDNRPP